MQSGLFRRQPDRFQGDDLVEGVIDKTQFCFSELKAEYKTETSDSKGRHRTQWHIIFKGLFFMADFNKHFNTKTFVLPDIAEKFLGFIGEKLQSVNRTYGELVKLEDPEFEEEFVVYSQDQVEARYILSPSFMKRVIEFKRKSGRKIHLSFVDSSLYLAISFDRGSFEPRLFQSSLNIEPFEEYYEDLTLIHSIVGDLNLNTRIWTKE
jgi:hypothetical protein